MKPIKIALCSIAVIAALSVQAETGVHFKPYVGLDYQYSSLSYRNINPLKINEKLVGHTDTYKISDILPTQLNGGALYFGARLSDHFGIEAGFAQSVNAKKNIATDKARLIFSEVAPSISGDLEKINGTGHLKMRSMYLDALGYLPLDAANGFALIGSVGIAQVKTKAKVSGDVTITKVGYSDDLATYNHSETDIRLGFGAQYQIVKNLSVRTMVRYQDLDLSNYGKGAYQVNLGLNYVF